MEDGRGKRKGARKLTERPIAHFPTLLHSILSGAQQFKYDHIISWKPHGKCFHIHDREKFVAEVLPLYFRQTKFASFQRQLNMYGFQRFSQKSPDRGSYYHRFLIKGRADLCRRIERVGRSNAPGTRELVEPNFYETTTSASEQPQPPSELTTRSSSGRIRTAPGSASSSASVSRALASLSRSSVSQFSDPRSQLQGILASVGAMGQQHNRRNGGSQQQQPQPSSLSLEQHRMLQHSVSNPNQVSRDTSRLGHHSSLPAFMRENLQQQQLQQQQQQYPQHQLQQQPWNQFANTGNNHSDDIPSPWQVQGVQGTHLSSTALSSLQAAGHPSNISAAQQQPMGGATVGGFHHHLQQPTTSASSLVDSPLPYDSKPKAIVTATTTTTTTGIALDHHHPKPPTTATTTRIMEQQDDMKMPARKLPTSIPAVPWSLSDISSMEAFLEDVDIGNESSDDSNNEEEASTSVYSV